MVLADPVRFEDKVDGKILKEVVYVASINSQWLNIITDGGPGVLDASPLVNPDTEIVNPTARIVTMPEAGTLVRVRMGYDVGVGGAIVSPVINAFARMKADPWDKLMNQNRQANIELTVDPVNDVTDGVFKYTLADIVLHSIDLVANKDLIMGISTAFTAAIGIVTNSFIQVKLLN